MHSISHTYTHTQVGSKHGYSWRVGVFPPDGLESSKMTQMQRLVRERSTKPALMQVSVPKCRMSLNCMQIWLHLNVMQQAIFNADPNGRASRRIVGQGLKRLSQLDSWDRRCNTKNHDKKSYK